MKYNLVGINGNAYCVMGYVTTAMKEVCRKTGYSNFGKHAQDAYLADAMSGDYDHLLCVSAQMIDKCNKAVGDEDEEGED